MISAVLCLRYAAPITLVGVSLALAIQEDCSGTSSASSLGAGVDVPEETVHSGLSLLQTYLSLSKVHHQAYAHGNSSWVPWNSTSKQYEKRKADEKMEATGIKFNSEGDLPIFESTFLANTFSFLFMVVIFLICSKLYPSMYSNNVAIGMAPIKIPDGIFGWMKASLAVMKDKEAKSKLIDAIGLDCVMLLEFSELCIKICVVIGVPLVFVVAPMHALFGGHVIAYSHDRLSIFSFGNVGHASRLYWLHPVVVWGVVILVTKCIHDAQCSFMELRYEWLRKMPEPRSTTLLVTHIPDDCASDASLKEYFTKLFPEEGPQTGIKDAYVAKKTTKLLGMIEQQKANIRYLEQEDSQADTSGSRRILTRNGQDAIDHYNQKIQDLDLQILEERKRIKDLSSKVGGVNSNAGFVTFNSRLDAQMAVRFDFNSSGDKCHWLVDHPPDPSTVIWTDMTQSHTQRKAYALLGYLLTAGLYMAYFPIVVGISQFCMRIDLPGAFNSLWKGFAPTIGLLTMMAFLPTMLILIFRGCFTLYDDLKAQWVLQNWYFIFMVVFILLVTAISGSIFEFMKLCAENPFSIPQYLGDTMPFATHFYMNYLMTQWVTHGMNLTRYFYLAKFIVFRRFYDDEEVVRELSEPEDQDYYGIGGRSARWTIMMCIGIIYGTLCPPMIVLCLINFVLVRLVYGYLMTFAEGRKGDMGGDCWVSCLQHLYVGLVIYVVVMSGVLYGRSDSNIPSLITAASLFHVLSSKYEFSHNFRWKHLPYPLLRSVSNPEAMQKHGSGKGYYQDELGEDTNAFRRRTSSSAS
jgi:hypothetical protein|mmetsp:Transcript_123517/g.193823  ORF Transcript_123517/g.193823 Transcript_123517/m.193823 type:complete len:802 (+) Transcript_123517:48-2453(+)